MKVLELFAGTSQVSAEFKKRGYETFTVDWNPTYDVDLHCDIGELTAKEILEKFGKPDIVFAAPDCTTYSLAAISHHRIKNVETGNLDPISDYAKKCDEVNQHVLKLIEELNPDGFFIENPRACLQKMTWMKPYDKYKYLITYCKYQKELPIEKRRMKPTNIWCSFPNATFEEPCKYGASDHPKTPRGCSTFGTQAMKGSKERSTYPQKLIEHFVDICDEYYNTKRN